jgi:hypothetical protein
MGKRGYGCLATIWVTAKVNAYSAALWQIPRWTAAGTREIFLRGRAAHSTRFNFHVTLYLLILTAV